MSRLHNNDLKVFQLLKITLTREQQQQFWAINFLIFITVENVNLEAVNHLKTCNQMILKMLYLSPPLSISLSLSLSLCLSLSLKHIHRHTHTQCGEENVFK